VSDSDLRQALLGTWRLVRIQDDPDSTPVVSTGDNLQGYLVYTPDEHMFIQFATRAERSWPGPEVFEAWSRGAVLPLPRDATGFIAYCGTFEVRDGQVVHRIEFGNLPNMGGRAFPRSVVLDGDRLLIADPRAHQRGVLEWQRVH
jgi:hypothetical protein